MEDKALEILRLMLGRRGLDTKTERVVTEDVKRSNVYTIGKVLVIFSQKDKMLESDISAFIQFARVNEFGTGIVLVGMSKPSENVLKVIKSYAKDRVQFFHIRQLQFDITTHRMVMPHRILKDDERKAVFDAYTITNPEEQLPWIDSQDPMARWVGAIPGDVLEVTRHSDVAGVQLYYRYCVEDVNVA
jgi:DNA-directed RNA polymerase I, II, and III subunit RPABC1